MKEFERGKDNIRYNRGEWFPLTDGGRATAYIICPNCEAPLGIAAHTIGSDGTVQPSVVCPVPQCGFHDFITLRDWPVKRNGEHIGLAERILRKQLDKSTDLLILLSGGRNREPVVPAAGGDTHEVDAGARTQDEGQQGS